MRFPIADVAQREVGEPLGVQRVVTLDASNHVVVLVLGQIRPRREEDVRKLAYCDGRCSKKLLHVTYVHTALIGHDPVARGPRPFMLLPARLDIYRLELLTVPRHSIVY